MSSASNTTKHRWTFPLAFFKRKGSRAWTTHLKHYGTEPRPPLAHCNELLGCIIDTGSAMVSKSFASDSVLYT